jgi:hypothetical protein
MNKTISFFLGLLFGIMICVLLFYFDVKFFESKLIQHGEKEVITFTKTDTVFVEPPPKPKKQYTEVKATESDVTENIDELSEEVSIYESEFSLEGVAQDEVFSDRLLQTKTVKVIVLSQGKQEVKLPDDFFQFFEIQRWSTPIKNKITYYRDKNMVKIKGMGIDNMNVVFWNDLYFLETGNRYYAIPETQYFEKLNLIQIPQ